MFYRVLAWYRGLSKKWKWIAWIVVAVVAIASVLIFALPWLMNARLRNKIKTLQADASVAKAKYQIEDAKKKVDGLEAIRDKAIADEAKHALKEEKFDKKVVEIEDMLKIAQNKVEEQTNDQQGNFFNDRYRNRS